ncbi:HAD family acid phosphatase [Parvularcula marina]|nr:HAD family acid phosphatase [Parvularcula marina]
MRMLILALTGVLAACATTEAPGPSVELKPETAWVAANEGWAEEAEAVYAGATSYVLEAAAGLPPKGWAVVLDLDETVINNVAYQIAREELGEGYTPESWYEWTQEEAATLVPGVASFLEAVNDAGGHVAFVTNRSDKEQLATENNLAALGLKRGEDFRVLMTRARPDGVSAKDARYDLVPPLLAVQGYPGVEIIAYLGDNKGDKPASPGDWAFFCIDQGAMYGDPCAAVPGPGR